MKEVLKKFESLNIKPMIGFEFEFYILDRNGLPIEQSRFFYNINEILQRTFLLIIVINKIKFLFKVHFYYFFVLFFQYFHLFT